MVLSIKVRQRGLRLLGQVKRREDTNLVRMEEEMKVDGCIPNADPGKLGEVVSRKTEKLCAGDDLMLNRDQRQRVNACPTPVSWEWENAK